MKTENSGFVNISRPAAYFTACYTVLKRPNKVEAAVHGCNLAFSLDSIVSLPRQAFNVVPALHHCLLVFLFLADQVFYRSYVNRQHCRLRSFASLCSAVQNFYHVVAGNCSALSFSLNFLSIFVHISGCIRTITLIWVLLERRQKWKKGQGSSRQTRNDIDI